MEQSFIAYLRGRCRDLPQVALGIGDDAAIIDPPDGQLVVCTDQTIDGVDFLISEHSLVDIGYKAIAINLSDVAAMGARPTSALVTLALPRHDATRIAAGVYDGILEGAANHKVAICGGDLSTYDGPLSISITLIGEVPRGGAWLRSGAQNGDVIFVTGPLGGSIVGRHLRPQPRLDLVPLLRSSVTVHAAIDISDSLSLDLDRLCAASRVGAELELQRIPIHRDAILRSETSKQPPLEHAWGDGEDFELILTMRPSDAEAISSTQWGQSLIEIGRVTSRTGLWSREQGKLVRVTPRGYLH
jgi:thiamine-monophosphate kinase